MSTEFNTQSHIHEHEQIYVPIPSQIDILPTYMGQSRLVKKPRGPGRPRGKELIDPSAWHRITDKYSEDKDFSFKSALPDVLISWFKTFSSLGVQSISLLATPERLIIRGSMSNDQDSVSVIVEGNDTFAYYCKPGKCFHIVIQQHVKQFMALCNSISNKHTVIVEYYIEEDHRDTINIYGDGDDQDDVMDEDFIEVRSMIELDMDSEEATDLINNYSVNQADIDSKVQKAHTLANKTDLCETLLEFREYKAENLKGLLNRSSFKNEPHVNLVCSSYGKGSIEFKPKDNNGHRRKTTIPLGIDPRKQSGTIALSTQPMFEKSIPCNQIRAICSNDNKSLLFIRVHSEYTYVKIEKKGMKLVYIEYSSRDESRYSNDDSYPTQ